MNSRRLAALAGLMILIVLVGPSAAAATASTNSQTQALSTADAIVLGAIEGVTEYLPISSTGHLLITQRILKVGQGSDKNAADTYLVVIQIGAILAVLGLYRNRFGLMIDGVFRKSRQGRSLLASLIIAFLPAAILAQLFGDQIKDRLLRPWAVVIAWTVGAGVIFLFVANQSRLRTRVSSVTAIPLQTAVGIGLAQSLALWPGTSRSLVTILAALALGLSLEVAVEFSFLLGFVTLSAATGYELMKNGKELIDTFGWLNPLIGIVVAGITAWISVRWMVTYLQKHSLAIFGWYRLGVAALAALLLITGAI